MIDPVPKPTIEQTLFAAVRLRWRLILIGCVLALSCVDAFMKWYSSRWVEVTVLNDSEQWVSNVTVSLPPESVQIGNLVPYEFVTKYVPRVVATKDWRPDQTGLLANGTHIQGDGLNSGERVFIPRFFYVMQKDGTVDLCSCSRQQDLFPRLPDVSRPRRST